MKTNPAALPQPEWSDPVAASAEARPGLSPYVHYWYDLQSARHPEWCNHHGGDGLHRQCGAKDGAGIPDQMQAVLQKLVERTFG